MDWLEVTVSTTPEALDSLAASLEDLGVEGLVINDEASIRSFLDNNPKAWDYVDDEIFSQVHGASSVQFYLEDSEEGLLRLAQYRAALPGETFSTKNVRDEDWLNNWKNYFKPIEIGRRLLVVPAWEPDPDSAGRVILRIEPKLAFGTGAHASTRMCMEELENHPARTVLDLGCGSGILAVAALLLGAESAVCCDIAPDAAAVCRDNALLNGINPGVMPAYTADILTGNTLEDITGGHRYDIVFANIIADVIIPLAPRIPGLLAPGGVFICSGIIDGRQGEVRAALEQAGLAVTRARQGDSWHMLAAKVAAPAAL
ncbi:ribosomal protein L11 methyltransferase [Sporobacter termitidis DSM 10068]|uniref:Ribosomal protein L11 methyltransferase n=1 Tax=Sporobacter termitidis DSM 10068 TaxID=1123282 RepID=A0A1M5ZHM7_9FIRM|nr:50S ribosomal protein L11 methyltransferase [Sporobacter termitidis]SHI23629.1 ribosomal protein L11 methyltransferase [Sporobacter termitidis DSM 10068]